MRWTALLFLVFPLTLGCPDTDDDDAGDDDTGDDDSGDDDAGDDDTAPPWPCDNPWEGSFGTEQGDDPAALQGHDCVLGNLFVAGTALAELSLPELEFVEGHTRISDNDQLATVALPALASVGTLEFHTNPALVSVDISALTTGNLALYVSASLTGMQAPSLTEGYLVLEGNPILASVDFPVLQTASGIRCYRNPQLPALSLPSLSGEVVPDGVWVRENDALTTLELGALTATGQIRVWDNPVLTTFTGLGPLETAGDLIINGEGVLTGLDGLSALETAGVVRLTNFSAQTELDLGALTTAERVEIEDWPTLVTVDLGALEEVAELFFWGLASLPTVSLSQLHSVGDLWIISNDSLVTVEGLSQLTDLSRSLVIQSNPLLSSLPGLGDAQLSTLGWVEVEYNPQLAELHLPSGPEVMDGELSVQGNDTLVVLDGLAGVERIEGTTEESCDEIDGPGYPPQFCPRSIIVRGNPALAGLSLAPDLEHLVGGVVLDELPTLTSAALPALASTDGSLFIEGTGLTGLEGLSSVTTVGEVLWIADNPCLEQSVAEAFAVGITVGGETYVENNAGPCP